MKLSTQFILTTLSKTGHQVSVFIISIILARYFTKDEYGTYLHVQLIVNLVVWGLLLGIPHSVYYFLPKVITRAKFILTTFSIISLIGVFSSFAVLMNIDLLSEMLKNTNLATLGLLVSLMIFFLVPLTIFEPLMITSGNVKYFVIVDIINNFIFFSCIILSVLTNSDINQIIFNICIAYLIQMLICTSIIFYIANISENNLTGEDYSIADQFKYSLPVGMSMGLVEASRYTDKIMISNQTSTEDYAVYARGAMELPVIGIIANTLDNLLMPKFVNAHKIGDIAALISIWHSVIRLMAATIYPCCLFLILTADLLIPALFSDKYIGSIIIFQIYTLGLLTRISTFNVIIRAIGKTNSMLWITVITMILNLICTYYFIQWFGLVGAPIATVVTLTLMRYLYIQSISEHLGISINKIMPWRSLFRSLLASTLAVIPCYLLKIIISDTINVWIVIGLLSLLYGTLYLYIIKNILNLDDIDQQTLRSVLPRKLKWVV